MEVWTVSSWHFGEKFNAFILLNSIYPCISQSDDYFDFITQIILKTSKS